MSNTIPASELVINPDGSIYHLHLQPEDIADLIFTVGDPNRVEQVARHFDRIEVQKSKREFVTCTGWIGKRRVSVVSTGIGPDNIDIVFNELDALANIDLATREVKPRHRQLTFVRLGTSGTLQGAIPVEGFVISGAVFGLDNLLHYYQRQPSDKEQGMERALWQYMAGNGVALPVLPYAVEEPGGLSSAFHEPHFHKGITLTSPGFYAPQGRTLRARGLLSDAHLDALGQFAYEGMPITNFEMETSAIYGLAALLGHRALSVNVILANRATRQFSPDPHAAVERMIGMVLDKIEDFI